MESGVERVGVADAMEFLTKIAVPGSRYAEEYSSRGLKVPTLAIIHDPGKKLALHAALE